MDSPSGCFSGAHFSVEKLTSQLGGADAKAGVHNKQKSGAAAVFSVIILDMQGSVRLPEESHLQSLHTPSISPQIGSNMTALMQSPETGVRLTNTQSENHPNEVSGPPIGGQTQQEVLHTAKEVPPRTANLNQQTRSFPLGEF